MAALPRAIRWLLIVIITQINTYIILLDIVRKAFPVNKLNMGIRLIPTH